MSVNTKKRDELKYYTVFVRWHDPQTITLAAARVLVRSQRWRTPFRYAGMTAACHAQLWAEAQTYNQAHGTPHPDMSDASSFMGLSVRIVEIRWRNK